MSNKLSDNQPYDFVKEILRISGICTICWEKSTKGCKYDDVCDECLSLTEQNEELDNL